LIEAQFIPRKVIVMRSTTRSKLFLLGLAAVLLVVSACTPTQATTPTSAPVAPATDAPTATPTPVPDKVKAVVLPYTSFGPFFIAQEEGYFADQNLEVEFVPSNSGTSPMPQLLEGQVDVLGSGPNIGLFNAITQGGVVKMVADKGYLASDGCTYMALLAPQSWVDQYNTAPVDALKNSKVSIDPTNFEAFMFEKVLSQSGLTLADTLPQDVAPPALSEAARNGAVDVISIGDPWITRLLDTNTVTTWKPYQEIVPNMQFGVVLFGPTLLNDRPDVGVRFIKAYLKGVEQYNLGKTDRNLEIMSKYTKLDVELLKRACWPPMHIDGMIDTSTVEAFQAWALSQDLIDQIVPVDSYWDPRFVTQAKP
jgi:NitT/TauT family transport system substrate-binding protein